MGAWGHGNFDNDTVLDWLADLEEESEHYEEWLGAVQELAGRIG